MGFISDFFFDIFLGGFCVFLIWVIYNDTFASRWHRYTAEKSKIILSNVRVISKSMEVNNAKAAQIIIFEFPDGVLKDFSVDSDISNKIFVDEEGKLAYKELNGTRIFVSFQSI